MGYWTAERVRLFQRAVERSDFPEKLLDALAPALAGCRDGVDVGAGVGAFTVPLARRLKTVTALEPSPAMRECLGGTLARHRLANVAVLPVNWGAAPLPPHDLILVANVAPVFDDLEAFVVSATPLARRVVAIVQNVGPGTEKFYFGELYPLLLGREYPHRADYLRTLTVLHARGVFANVRIVEYDFDQPFADFDEAAAFWTNRLSLRQPDQIAKLTEFLRGKLRREGGGWLAPMRRRSAAIWWRTDT
jgi:hypothetical protein